MDDLISRQAAIEAIEFGITYLRILNTETGEVTDPFAKINDELREAVNRVKDLPSAQQWHTGEPTEDGDYLCYKYGDDDGFGYFYVDTYYTHNGTVEYGTPLAYKGWQDGHDRILAWMPLPEPWKGDEE